MPTNERIYARSIIRRSKKEIARFSQAVVVLSPYLTSQTAETVIGEADPNTSEIYTTFKAETFASGGSSISTIRTLVELGYNVYELSHLHAKTILTKNIGLVGSQNLTRGGTKNREISVAITDRNDIRHLKSKIAKWAKDRRLITLEMIQFMEQLLPDLKQKYDLIQKQTLLADLKIEQSIKDREAERRQKEEERKQIEVAKKRKALEQQRMILQKRSEAIRAAVNSDDIINSNIIRTVIDSKTTYDEWGDETGAYSTLVRRRPNVSFLKWRVPNPDGSFVTKTLKKRNRYLLLLLENGRLSWPALNKTQITQYGVSMTHTSSVQIGDHWYAMDFSFAEGDDDLKKWNVKTRIYPVVHNRTSRQLAMSVFGYFSVNSLEVVSWSIDDSASREAPEFLNLIEQIENGSIVQNTIIRNLLSPFQFTSNRFGVSPRSFFRNQGNYFNIRLRQFGDYYFLTAEKTY